VHINCQSSEITWHAPRLLDFDAAQQSANNFVSYKLHFMQPSEVQTILFLQIASWIQKLVREKHLWQHF
jgi:hypothetical protein